MEPKTILFLCTGNSCRSQIAEGWAKALGKDRYRILSAGIEAHGKNPNAIRTMADAGIDISMQESTRLSDAMLQQTDVLVTVCGHADENCPVVSTDITKYHWPLNDPAKASGTEDEITKIFAASRDDIRQRVENLFQDLEEKHAD